MIFLERKTKQSPDCPLIALLSLLPTFWKVSLSSFPAKCPGTCKEGKKWHVACNPGHLCLRPVSRVWEMLSVVGRVHLHVGCVAWFPSYFHVFFILLMDKILIKKKPKRDEKTYCLSCCSVTQSWPTLCNNMDFTVSQSLLKLMSIELVMPSNHLILCRPLLLLSSVFLASGSFLMSQFFTSSGQSIGASASSSVLPVNIQDWFPLGLTDLISLQSQFSDLSSY